ncbi:S-layer homology domain-containing protein [Synechocystis sp. PCC 7509]|uniref:S-layer homology domain-containing protein n=1 Tax=Synechocystis sp. PCC 7509 TaxID=927677 RepID=UPI0002ABE194|nr:S-layer homology domain-containing protein [Synechocystis sp. PCC 7509]
MAIFINRLQAGTAGLMAIALSAGSVAPLFISAPVFAQNTSFNDVSSNYWASPFIAELARRDIIAGFPDNTFRPDQPVTRAQFAAIVRKAFAKSPERNAINFTDVSANYWASSAIQEAYRTGFLSGYPGNRFQPEQNIPREQVLVSLSSGLDYNSNNSTVLSQYYSDDNSITSYARNPIAAATEKGIVVNYPNVRFLNPTRTATRADVSAFIYQALVDAGQVSAINSAYVVGQQPQPTTPTTPQAITIPSGTTIPVKYDQAERILVTREETAPLTLTVAQNVVTSNGTVLIPARSKVVGELRPANNGSQFGSQFYAQELVFPDGQKYNISATSNVITKTERIRKGINVGNVVKNAALGAAAAAAISAVTGDRALATEEILGGAGIGTLVGLFLGRKVVDLIAIDPDTDLQLTLTSNLVLNR